MTRIGKLTSCIGLMVVLVASNGAAAFASAPMADNAGASALQVAACLAVPGQALPAQVAAEALKAAAQGFAAQGPAINSNAD